MGNFSSLLPIIGSAFGPVGGAVGTLASGLIGGSNSQNMANGANQVGLQQSELPGSLYGQYAPGWLSSISKMNANPGAFGLQQDAQTNPLVFGDQTKALLPGADTMISQFGDNAATQLQQNTGALTHELGGAGFAGANSMAPSAEGQLIRGTSADVAANKANVGVQAADQMYQRGQYAQQTGYNEAQNSAQRLMQSLGLLSPGNVGGIYQGGQNAQTLANAETGGAATAAGTLAPYLNGGLGGLFSGLFGGGGSGGSTYPGSGMSDSDMSTLFGMMG
jgi:hypothetical protein